MFFMRTWHKVFIGIALLLSAALAVLAAQMHADLSSFKQGSVSIRGREYRVLLATNATGWREGLMNVSQSQFKSTGAIGMLFLFPNDTEQCFWMENTEMPLLQLWIENNTVVYAYNATPRSTAVVCHDGKEILELPVFMHIAAGNGDSIVYSTGR